MRHFEKVQCVQNKKEEVLIQISLKWKNEDKLNMDKDVNLSDIFNTIVAQERTEEMLNKKKKCSMPFTKNLLLE